MLTPVSTKQFEKDIKRNKKRSKNLEKFKIIARTLLEGEQFDLIHRDHNLTGNYRDCREYHTESD